MVNFPATGNQWACASLTASFLRDASQIFWCAFCLHSAHEGELPLRTIYVFGAFRVVQRKMTGKGQMFRLMGSDVHWLVFNHFFVLSSVLSVSSKKKKKTGGQTFLTWSFQRFLHETESRVAFFKLGTGICPNWESKLACISKAISNVFARFGTNANSSSVWMGLDWVVLSLFLSLL